MSRGRTIAALMLGAAAAGGCYERDVNYKPFFAGLAGAQFNTPPTGAPQPAQPGTPADPRIVIENPDGSVTLIARRGLHLMRHIQRTLAKGERDLFVEQVLSERTRNAYRERGLDPGEAFDTLKRHEREINALFKLMPFGEQTPQVVMSKQGENTFRVKLTGAGTRDLQWTYFDMILERGHWRLLWFGPVTEPGKRRRKGEG